MEIERDGPDYLYLQLAALLRIQITSGKLPPRSRVPSITELAAAHDVATMTARRALAVLADEGLIEMRPGRGTYVRERMAP